MKTAHPITNELDAIPMGEIQVLSPVSAPHVENQRGPAPIVTATQRPVTLITLSPGLNGLLSNRLAVVAILALVGPIGLPALWLSPRFSRIAKILTTVLFLLATVALPLAMAYYWLEIALRPLVDAFGQVHNS